MILTGTLMLPAEPRQIRLTPGYLRIDGSLVAEVHEGDCPHTPDLGDENTLICPGFVDTHLHLPQFDSIGADGLTLLDWLDRVIFPAEARWADADFAGQMTHRAIRRLLAAGTTSFAAYATVHHAAARSAIEAAASLNLRAAIGQVLMDQQAPPELIRPAKQLIDECASLFSGGPSGRASASRVSPAVTPRFAITCSAALLRAAGDIAAAHDALIQTHLAETQKECQAVFDLHDRLDYTEVYHRAGLLTPRAILGHGIWLDAAARQTLAQTQAVVAHCPTANLFLNAGTMDRHLHHMAGVRTSLGSDIGAGPDRCMVRVARAMIEAAKTIGRLPPTAAECWHQITRGNADALGFSDVGRLEVGVSADIVMFTPDIPWRDQPNPPAALLYNWDERWIDRVFVAGIEAEC